MKWGHLDSIEESNKLIYWVLMFVLSPYEHQPIDYWLKEILLPGGALGGDPGWEIEHLRCETGEEKYRVWANSEVSGIEPDELCYDGHIVRDAICESLIAYSAKHVNKAAEVTAIINKYKLISQ